MNKNTIYKILIMILIIAIAFATILSVYTFKNLYNAGSFKVDLLLYFVGSVALTLALFIASVYFVIKMIGEKK